MIHHKQEGRSCNLGLGGLVSTVAQWCIAPLLRILLSPSFDADLVLGFEFWATNTSKAVFVESWPLNCGVLPALACLPAFGRTLPVFQLRAKSWGRAAVQTKIQLFSHLFRSSSHQQANNDDGHLWSEQVDDTVPHSLEKIRR